MKPVMRHADHDPSLVCRPAMGNGLCEPLTVPGQVLVVLGGECEEAPGSKCVMAVIQVADRDEARRIMDGLLPGEVAHWMGVRPASDYLPDASTANCEQRS